MILQARGVEQSYGKVQILHGLDLEIREGRITTIIGPNGAGKSTALKALFGLVEVSSGQVLLRGKDVTNATPREMVRHGVCFVPQGRAVFKSLSVAENLRMGGYLERDTKTLATRRDEVFARFPRLQERRDQAAGSLSGGEQQMLAIGRALMADPDILLLDEPSVGLAPQVVEEILQSLEDLNQDGKTLVIIEQNATMALETCDHAYLLVRGQVKLEGSGADLLADPQVKDLYLGG